jgi:hypothetical protein
MTPPAHDVRFIVAKYIRDDGWSVLPIPKGSKAPEIKDWVNRTFDVGDFDPDSNIGVRLGAPSGNLTDVDLDCPQAVTAAPFLLPRTERIHGRPGTGQSHYWYICEGAKSEKWCDVDGKVLLEIRSTGGQTVIPPSVHPSGEVLDWAQERTPAKVAYANLVNAGRYAATSALMARHWPKGSRHFAALHLAGFLAARDLDVGTICNIVRGICAAAKDEELDVRLEAVSSTVKAFNDGGKTTGGPALADHVGREVVDLLVKWYGGNSAIHEAVIKELNANRFAVRVGKDTVYGLEEDDTLFFQPARALYEWYANQKVQVGTKSRGEGKGDPIHKTKFEIWREHPNRRSYRRVVFAPPPFHVDVDPRDYNLWTNYTVAPLMPERGTGPWLAAPEEQPLALRQWADQHALPICRPFLDLTHDVICDGVDAHYAYMVNLLALTIQLPGVPSEVATVMKGEQGAGKGTFARTIGALFGRHYIHLDRTEQLAGKFNAALSAKVVVFADEAFFAGDKRDLGSLKRLITEPTLAIERKGIDIIEEPNFIHLFMATNEDWAHQAGMKERRFFTVHVSNKHVQDHAYFNHINAVMKKGGPGLPALLCYLLTRAIDRDAVRSVPRTKELREQQEMSLPNELKWWRSCLYRGALGIDGKWPTHVLPDDAYGDYLRWCDQVKVNRRVTDIDLMRRVLAPWLDARVRRDNKWVRPVLALAEARALFDKQCGTSGEWEDLDEPGKMDQMTRGEKDLPF